MPKFIDLTGHTFGRITVIKRAPDLKKGFPRWECQCVCGTTVICWAGHLRSGRSQSCGCLQREQIKKLNLTHNKSNSLEYKAWAMMKARCLNPKCKDFKYYGGRGIAIYPEWIKSFIIFYEHIGPKPTPQHTIERINNNLGYFPGNVKWATRIEQMNNCRSNRNITFENKTMSLTQWAKILNVDAEMLYYRIVTLKWPIEKAFNEPNRYSHGRIPQSQIPRSSPDSCP